ncbi:hypothetical protein L0222_03845 [bacterium]|nr:hypothetical protein [bacterium]MCI0602639.1 hypothetical protein [bacterium]
MKRWLILFGLMASIAFAGEPSLLDFKRKTYLLSDMEVEKIKEEIRTRCRLPQANEMTYPWYYHYELGMAMQKKKDWQRALDSLLASLDRRERPQKFTRIYGMWFIDYFPYYNIGVAHYHLKNWNCAVQSFRLSQMFEDIPKDSVEFYRLRELDSEAEQQLRTEN